MRILFCNYEYPPIGGGGGVVNALLAEELANRHDVTVLTSHAFDLAKEEVVRGVRVIRVPVLFRRRYASANFPSMFAYMVTGAWRGRKLIRSERFDVVNTHFALPSGPVGDWIARRSGTPNVLSLHGGDLYDPSKRSSPHRHPLLVHWVSALVHRANQVVAQSQNTAANLRIHYTNEVLPAIVPLGIRRPTEGVASRADYGIPGDAQVMVTVGRLVARKAVDQLIDVVAHSDSRVCLIIVGNGPLESDLQRLAADKGVAERVHFLGFVAEQEKFAVLRMSDVFVCASQHEGFGLVFLEAMACGLPIVCYDYGGQTDFLADGTTGRLVELNDQSRLLQSCTDLLEDNQARDHMSRTNKQRVENYFIERCASQYEEIFQQVCDLTQREGISGVTNRS